MIIEMKHSIRIRFTLIFTTIIAATIAACLFINKFFLEDYYLSNKQKVLMEAYENMNRFLTGAVKENESDNIKQLLLELRESSSISVLVIDRNWDTLYSSTPDMVGMLDKLRRYIFTGGKAGSSELWIQEKRYESDNYSIMLTMDQAVKTSHMESWGFFDEGSLFLMSLPVESIRESVAISNKFYSLVGMAAILLSGGLMLYMTRKLTQPIQELSVISEQMANLNFQVRYRSESQDELGILGNSMNHLSDTLQETIGELQEANETLKRDIQEKIQVDDMRKEFLSNVSHELKTPIAIIQGYAEGLKDCINEDEESRDYYCDVIMDEACKMNQMVQKLLNLNQLEFGDSRAEMEVFDIMALMKGVVHASEILVKQKEGTLLLPEGEPVYVRADEFMIEEVLKNYLSNAIHHLDGKKQIRISLERLKERLKISVFNTGSQIPAEDLDKVWIKFFKVDKARTREYGGSGIGLSIVKAIMDNHRQSCGVENKEDGVEFWFTLELAAESDEKQAGDTFALPD